MNAIVPIVRINTLAQYDAARTALAEACRIDEVLSVRNESERMHLYARQAKDRALMADAVEIRLRAERRLGELIRAQKETVGLNIGARGQLKGRDTSGGAMSEPPEDYRPTLEEAGIDKKLSSIAQKRAAISDEAFDTFLKTARERVISDKAKIISAPGANEANRVQNAGDLDYSPTCPWATRALIECVLPHLDPLFRLDKLSAWEPACGEGHMAEVLREYFKSVVATDIHDGYFYADHIGDFLDEKLPPFKSDWIITNPPFEDRVIKFIVRALALAKVGVAMFLHLRYLEGIGRYEQIYSITPPTIIAPFVERVPLLMGQYDPDASTTTAFMWLVWIKGMAPQAPFWIPPGQRDALTRPDDAARFTQHPVQRRVA